MKGPFIGLVYIMVWWMARWAVFCRGPTDVGEILVRLIMKREYKNLVVNIIRTLLSTISDFYMT